MATAKKATKKTTRPKKAPAPSRKVLVLRTCKADMTSHNGFQWPESGPVECPDWNPEPVCGGGLHGLLWGEGNWSLLNKNHDAKWLIVEVDSADLVEIDKEKCKFRRGVVVFCGDMATAVTRVLTARDRFERLFKESGGKSSAEGNSSTAASSGDFSKAASSGDFSTAASSGDFSTAASSGDFSTAASSGNSSTAASSGDFSTAASSGNGSKAASSGNGSKAASSGNSSTAASSGDFSTAASSGNGSKAEATGRNTVAMAAGLNCLCRAGENGSFASCWWDGKRHRIAVAYVGENGIEPNVWYRLNDKGEWVKA